MHRRGIVDDAARIADRAPADAAAVPGACLDDHRQVEGRHEARVNRDGRGKRVVQGHARGEDRVALAVRTDREPRDAREQRGDAAGACCGRGGPLRHVGVAEQATVRHVEPDHRRVGVGAEHTVGGLGVLQHIGLADEVVAIAFLRERASHEHDARP